ncbi:anthranilate phosphoribosyltransferase [Pontibacter beigongshangensis]|uniref:anthranilate phosphoribosyltransferase n=1 Tax=Pontibacter beigongshangensis TaxID=2574733 RepID=UPI001650716A|nr:anthranilate phosphoribosyltransferase [Pontibacter beigongshangensis]
METTQQDYTTQDNPLVQGIKLIGIGKHGSKPLPESLLRTILDYLKTGDIIPIQNGAFYGALMAKGPTPPEQQLLLALVPAGTAPGPDAIYDSLCADAPGHMREIGIKLLRKEFLTLEEARQLGEFLYSDLPGESYRGMAASMLRIRYETEEEYRGLIESAELSFTPGFREPVPPLQEVLLQLAEPFDGVEHSYMITPLLAQAFQQDGFRVISTVGRSSGPKLTLNALDLYEQLEGEFLNSPQQLLQEPPRFGWVLDQQILSPALDQWVDRRRLIFKRPFLATSEKVLNPAGAHILVTSVFHITYMEKMIKLADMAGFKGAIILKRGLEGTLAPSLAKASGILCAARQQDGSFITHTIDADTEALAHFRAGSDENVAPLLLEENIRLIRDFAEHGFTDNQDFNKRVNLSMALYNSGLQWVQQHWQR